MTAFPTQHASGVQYGGLPDAAAQEHLSRNYVRAVATAARCDVGGTEGDFEGVDISFNSLQPNHSVAYPMIYAQLKCTQQADLIHDDYVAWKLDRPNYDQLRVKVAVPRILIVMHCPTDFTSWLRQDQDSLAMSHAAYWMSLAGQPALAGGQQSKTVRVPRNQPFTVEALLSMMDKTGRGVPL